MSLMAEAICSRHFRTFTQDCIRCGEVRAINGAVAERAREKARMQAEFDRMALVPMEPRTDSPPSEA
jgi:hypothetical protein